MILASKLLNLAQKKLMRYKSASPNLDARILLAYCLGLKDNYFKFDKKVSNDKQILFENLIQNRIDGKPVSRITSKKSFWKDEFYINSHCLDPRPDSEIIIESVINSLNQKKLENFNILDLGTGSGCLILSILREFSKAKGIATDISIGAIEVAKLNSKKLKLFNNINFVVSDWCQSLNGLFDVIVINPPYIKSNEIKNLQIEVKNFDPKISLDGGEDGLQAYIKIAPNIRNLLTNKGLVFCEIGYKQTKEITKIFHDNNLRKLFIKKDLSGKNRCIIFGH